MGTDNNNLFDKQNDSDAAVGFDVPDDPRRLIVWLEHKYETALKVRPDFQPRINLAFYRGSQWVVF